MGNNKRRFPDLRLMTFATVYVFPDPVTQAGSGAALLFSVASTSFSIAAAGTPWLKIGNQLELRAVPCRA